MWVIGVPNRGEIAKNQQFFRVTILQYFSYPLNVNLRSRKGFLDHKSNPAKGQA